MGTKILIIVLLLVIILAVFVTIRVPKPQTQTPVSQDQGVIQTTASPTAEQKLYVKKVEPSTAEVSVTAPIIITFSKPVDKSTVFFAIRPEATVSASFVQTSAILTIEPVQTWAYDTTYTVIISKEASGLDGTSLGQGYQFNFKTEQYRGI